MADNELTPTPEELNHLKDRRAALKAAKENALTLEEIKPGMTQEQKKRVKDRIAELWK